jgi:nicotinamidase-related amidase
MTATTLLIMDVQQDIIERYADDGGYLERLATAIAAARSAGITVTYVTIAFRPDCAARLHHAAPSAADH